MGSETKVIDKKEHFRKRMKELLIIGYHSMSEISDDEMEACLNEIEAMTKKRVQNVMNILNKGNS